MLKIDKEESDNDSDRPPNKSVPNTPSKDSTGPNDTVNSITTPRTSDGSYNNTTLNTPVLPNKVCILNGQSLYLMLPNY